MTENSTEVRAGARPGSDEVGFWSLVPFAAAAPAESLPPGIDRGAMQLFMTLRRATDLLFYDLRAPVRESGVSETGFSLIFVLNLVGRVSIKRLVELSGLSKASCSAAVRTLTADGFVHRSSSDHDGRAVMVELSDKGRQAIQTVFPLYNKREQEWAETLSEEDRAHLLRILNLLMQKGRTALRRNGPAE